MVTFPEICQYNVSLYLSHKWISGIKKELIPAVSQSRKNFWCRKLYHLLLPFRISEKKIAYQDIWDDGSVFQIWTERHIHLDDVFDREFSRSPGWSTQSRDPVGWMKATKKIIKVNKELKWKWEFSLFSDFLFSSGRHADAIFTNSYRKVLGQISARKILQTIMGKRLRWVTLQLLVLVSGTLKTKTLFHHFYTEKRVKATWNVSPTSTKEPTKIWHPSRAIRGLGLRGRGPGA